VTANLVVGVPSFDFKDTIDPIALQQTLAQLSQYFQSGVQTANMMSNAIMTQTARMGEYRAANAAAPAPPIDLGPEVKGSQKSEDLFVFTVEHITLKKGERMVIPVTDFTLKYKDVYTLNVPFAPPPDVRRQFNTEQQAELGRLFSAAKLIHKIRLANDSKYPLTTAPALIVAKDRVLAQGMMTYSAIGAQCDLSLTTAVDIRMKKTDQEAKRTPNAAQWNSEAFIRIDLDGKINLTSFGDKPVEIEVTRDVLGIVTSAESGGKIETLNLFEDGSYLPTGDYPTWWHWYAWPYWWHHFNSISKITWNVRLEPKQEMDLKYSWAYYWH
jgi:hypothetical protein